ncbi:MAG: hypothetical protein ACRBCT_02625 [Alphaproteobacteria bacterium]
MSRVSLYLYGLFGAAALLLFNDPALAQNATDIAENINDSIAQMPGLVSAICYLIGLILGVSGILKLKAHVENPGEGGGQVPLRTPMIRLIVGGMMFALPIMYEAMAGAFGNGSFLTTLLSNPLFTSTQTNAIFGINGQDTSGNFNAILQNINNSIGGLPGLITAISYLAGLVIGAMGALKLKEHVENADQVTLKEPVIRFLVAGAFFSLPAIFNAMFETINGSGVDGLLGSLTLLFGGSGNIFSSTYAASACAPGSSGAGSLICGIISNAGLFPSFLTAISYLFGLVLGVWGIVKIRDHVLNPQQTQVMEGIARFIAGGGFFALPAIISVFSNTVGGGASAASPVTSYNEGSVAGGACSSVADLGLDGRLACFVNDIFGPMHSVLNLFAFIAGTIFIMIGISRLIKGAQEGAKGPGGLGTIMTFIMGGALVSYNEIVRATTTTLTGSSTTLTFAELQYTNGLSNVAEAEAVITAIIKFMIIVGLISFVRGLFIVRDVAEGSQQASMMAGLTHIIGGAAAINLGPLLAAIQTTLGISTFGIGFS